MKTKLDKKIYHALLIGLYIGLPLLGWYLGRMFFEGYLGCIILSVIGFIGAFLVDHFLPRWNFELTWKDIDLVLNNIYNYGPKLMEFWFYVGGKRILIYRHEEGSNNNTVFLEVGIPEKEWSDLMQDGDLDELVNKTNCRMTTHDYGKERLIFFTKHTKENPEFCIAILKFLFMKSVGGLRSEIMAESHTQYWLDYSLERNKNSKRRMEKRRTK